MNIDFTQSTQMRDARGNVVGVDIEVEGNGNFYVTPKSAHFALSGQVHEAGYRWIFLEGETSCFGLTLLPPTDTTEAPPKWALRLACERIRVFYIYYSDGDYSPDLRRAIEALARMIAKHEPELEPVDPLSDIIRECLHDTMPITLHDTPRDGPSKETIMAFVSLLKERGIELGEAK